MEQDEENGSQANSLPSSALTIIPKSSETLSQSSDVPKIPSGISITPASQEPKSSFAHPSIKTTGNENQMPPPPISIKLSNLQKNASEAVNDDEEGDDDDESEEESESEEDEDGVEEVGIDDSDEDDGEDDAEVCDKYFLQRITINS